MKYCIDSSALIDLGERHYPEHVPVFAPIWEYLYTAINNGELISVDYVREELNKKADDWRTVFLGKAEGMFLMNEGIEQEFANVVKDIEVGAAFNKNGHRDRFMSGADPWLIALARSMPGQCTIVSAETKPLASYGLGAVCQALIVPHMNLVQLFQARNIGG